MKKAGILIFLIGLLISLVTGFSYVTREKVVDVGKIQITMDQNHGIEWSPLIGFAVTIVGAAIYLFGAKKN